MEQEYKNILNKTSILLVEDDNEIRTKFKSVLEIFAKEVYEAANGQDALEIFKSKKPNLLITDVKMPIMDGLELTTLIRQLDKNIPIVIISAFSEKELLLNFISLNLVEYIIKPLDFNQLNDVLIKCAKKLKENGLIEFRLNDDTIYSFSKRSLICNDNIITLTPKEVTLLELLIKNKTKLVSKQMIESTVYNMEPMSVSALNNLTSKLRKKIGTNNILTISSFGFMLCDEK